MTGKIKLVHSGGNSVSIAVPTSAPSASEVEFKLPQADGSANQYIKTDGSGNLGFATLPAAGGITQADSWYVNAALQPASGGNTITANWARDTRTETGSIGSAMTQSSGVFTFPSTGIYYISINGGVYRGTGSFNYIGLIIQATTDDSNYNDQTVTYNALPDQSGNTYSSMSTYFIFDVTNTSTHKVRFQTEASGTGTTVIDIGGRRLNVIFIRLGDT